MDQFMGVPLEPPILHLLRMLTPRMYLDRLNDIIYTFIDKLPNVAIQILIFLSIHLG